LKVNEKLKLKVYEYRCKDCDETGTEKLYDPQYSAYTLPILCRTCGGSLKLSWIDKIIRRRSVGCKLKIAGSAIEKIKHRLWKIIDGEK